MIYLYYTVTLLMDSHTKTERDVDKIWKRKKTALDSMALVAKLRELILRNVLIVVSV